jgi:hypothetical protein
MKQDFISSSGKRAEPTGDKLVQAEQKEARSPRRTRVNEKPLWGLHVGQPDWPVPENRCADVGCRCQKESSLDPEDTKKRWVVMA